MKNPTTRFITYLGTLLFLIVMTLYYLAKKDSNITWDEFFSQPLLLGTTMCIALGFNSWRAYRKMKKSRVGNSSSMSRSE